MGHRGREDHENEALREGFEYSVRYLRICDIRTGKALTENPVRPPGVAEAGDVAPGGCERRMMMLGPAGFTPDGLHLVATMGVSFHIIETATGRVEKSSGKSGDNSSYLVPQRSLIVSSVLKPCGQASLRLLAQYHRGASG